MSAIRVIKASEHATLPWNEVPRPPGDDTPPGEDVLAFESRDQRFTTGLWRRPKREGEMVRPYDEVSIIIEGVAEVVDPDGAVHHAQPGDVLVTPRGSGGTWRCVSDVKKFWAISETDAEAPGTWLVQGDGPLAWEEIPTDDDDPNLPGEEVVSFKSADGRFVAGFWRRGPETGPMVLSDYHEIAYFLEGLVTVTDQTDGSVFEVGPGDILITPKGTNAIWQSHSPVRKFWVIDKEA